MRTARQFTNTLREYGRKPIRIIQSYEVVRVPVYFSKEYTTSANITAAATSTERFISQAEEEEYGPFDEITVLNQDATTLRINFNFNVANTLTVAPNAIERSKQKLFKNFSITNTGSSTHTAGTVTITVQNTRFPRRN